MKYFFYPIALIATAGAFTAVVNPALLQQGAAFIGLELPKNLNNSDEEITEEDQLAKFEAQYLSVHQQDNSFIPAANVPEDTHPVFSPPPVYPAPATPFAVPSFPELAVPFPTPPPAPAAEPVAEPAAAVIAQDFNNWDGETSAPIFTPPVVVPPAPVEWTVSPQPVQEPMPLPPSVYVVTPTDIPKENVFQVTREVEPEFAQTRLAASTPLPVQSMPPQPAASPGAMPGTMLHTPATLIEDVPVHGTEIAAKVGRQVILLGDILPRLRRASLQIVAANLKSMPEEKRAEIKPQEIELFIDEFAEKMYPEILAEQILFALIYSDYDMSMDKATKNAYNDRLGDEFDRNEIPNMMKEFNVDNVAALKRYLEEQLGSSLEKERRLWIREELVKQWMGTSMKRATAECTHDEMMDFYEKNKAGFTSPTKARWQEMTVLFSKYKTEQEARDKIVWMGNQVAQGASFDEIAKANSDGFTAPSGGIRDWTSKGSLTSEELEQAVFSQPIGQLSPAIIRSGQGFHIVKVLERKETSVVPFLEAQSTIREMIKRQRAQQQQEEYFSNLRRRFPTMIIKDHIDFKVSSPRSSSILR